MKDEILKLRNEGKTYKEISEVLGCSKSTISYHCNKDTSSNDEEVQENIIIKNILSHKDKYFLTSKENIKEIIKLRKEKKTYDEIAKKLKIKKHIVKKICTKLNLSQIRKFGKIDKKTILKMKDLYKELGSSLKVAKELSVSKATVLKYVDVKKKSKMTNEEKKKKSVESVINWRKRKKIELINYKGGKCEKCGYNKCVDALEFHHINPLGKDFTISGKSWSFDRLKKEVNKCILVCSNCHKEIHYELRND